MRGIAFVWRAGRSAGGRAGGRQAGERVGFFMELLRMLSCSGGRRFLGALLETEAVEYWVLCWGRMLWSTGCFLGDGGR